MDTARIKKYFSLEYYKRRRIWAYVLVGVFILGYIITRIEYGMNIGCIIIVGGIVGVIALFENRVTDEYIDKSAGCTSNIKTDGKYTLQNYRISDDAPFMYGRDLKIRTPYFDKAVFDFSFKKEFSILITETNLIEDTSKTQSAVFNYDTVQFKKQITDLDNAFGRVIVTGLVIFDDENSVYIPINSSDSTVDRVIEEIKSFQKKKNKLKNNAIDL